MKEQTPSVLDLQMSAKHMELTPSLRSFVQEKFSRLTKHSNHIIRIHIHFEVNKLRHLAKSLINLPHSEINASAESENMYKSIDLLLDKLIKQLDDYSSKQNQH